MFSILISFYMLMMLRLLNVLIVEWTEGCFNRILIVSLLGDFLNWQLKFNLPKCSWVGFGLAVKPILNYKFLWFQLVMSVSVKDLGVLFDFKLLFSNHCNSVVNKAYIRVNMLLWCFFSRDRILQMKLFNTYVRSILECNIPLWSSHLVKDFSVIEHMYKFFTKRLKGLKNVPYSQRLTILNQPTPQSRRSRSDLFCQFKIINNLTDANLNSFFQYFVN